MDTPTIIVQGVPMDALLAQLREIVRAELAATIKPAPQDERLLSPRDTAALFSPSISLVTLYAWRKKGLLTAYAIGGRVYYKQSEVLQAMQTLGKFTNQKGGRANGTK